LIQIDLTNFDPRRFISRGPDPSGAKAPLFFVTRRHGFSRALPTSYLKGCNPEPDA